MNSELLTSLVAQKVKPLPTMWETWVQSLGWEDPLEKGMANHSSILATTPHPQQKKWPFPSPVDRIWPTGEENGKPLQYSCLENPMNSMKRQNDRILKEELPRSVGAQYATEDQWRNYPRKNEGMEP